MFKVEIEDLVSIGKIGGKLKKVRKSQYSLY